MPRARANVNQTLRLPGSGALRGVDLFPTIQPGYGNDIPIGYGSGYAPSAVRIRRAAFGCLWARSHRFSGEVTSGSH